MRKAKVGVLLAGAYVLGAGVLVVLALSLPCGTLQEVRSALARVPDTAHRAAALARVAVHAGTLGMKHLPAVLEPQGVFPQHRSLRFCTREPAAGCGSSATPTPLGLLRTVAPVVVHVVVRDDG